GGVCAAQGWIQQSHAAPCPDSDYGPAGPAGPDVYVRPAHLSPAVSAAGHGPASFPLPLDLRGDVQCGRAGRAGRGSTYKTFLQPLPEFREGRWGMVAPVAAAIGLRAADSRRADVDWPAAVVCVL